MTLRRNRQRSARVYARGFGVGGRRGEAVRAMACLVTDSPHHQCTSPTRACHARARGRGGVKGGARDLWPGCDAAHREAGELGSSARGAFELRHGVDVTAAAERIAEQLDEQLGPEPCYLCGQVGTHAPLCRTVEARGARRAAE